MPIKPNEKHPDWEAMEPFWSTVNDIIEGSDAVRAAKEAYLPRFPNETQRDYDFRVLTAKFTNVYRDILEGLAQKPFAKELTVQEDAPERIQGLVNDVDGRGNSLHVFSAETFFNGINKAIEWIFVDYTKADGLRTVEEESRAGVRPYWIHIPPEKVTWIESGIIDGREQLTRVHILEADDRYRELFRDGDRAWWEVWEEREVADKITGQKYMDWVMVDEGIFTIGIIPMVPFITGRRKGASWRFHPPMRDAVDLQIELYQQESSLKNIKTLTAFPMLAGNGVEQNSDAAGNPVPVPVGPKAVLYAPPNSDGNHGEWKWMQSDAAVLNFLAEDIKSTIKELRELGRQPLTAQSGNLTVITTAFAAAKGNSAVQAWAIGLKDALERALDITAMWLGETYEPDVFVYTDFDLQNQSNEDITHLIELRKGGADKEPDISLETLWHEIKRRGVFSPEFDADEELVRLLGEIPAGDSEADATN